VHVRGEQRLSVLVRLVSEESREQRPGREVVLTRLLEVLLIEALRSTAKTRRPACCAGWPTRASRPRCAQMHGDPARAWTVAQLAKKAALSRSAFFERFTRAVGLPPMEYLLAWRMALAKDLLRRSDRPSPRWPNAWATARRAPSARRSAGTWGSRRSTRPFSGGSDSGA
jgi:AraC-like DNA-binding protein